MSTAYRAFHPANGVWSVGAWIKNLENTARVEALATNSIYGRAPGSIQPPRTFGLRVGFNFN
jgi:outer membrane receptor protein involved in Fe transport